MNQIGNSMRLTDQSGVIVEGTPSTVDMVALNAVLAGALQITGICDADGQPLDWLIPQGSIGTRLPPGDGACSRLTYEFSNPVDAGKAWAAWLPR